MGHGGISLSVVPVQGRAASCSNVGVSVLGVVKLTVIQSPFVQHHRSDPENGKCFDFLCRIRHVG